MSFSVHRLGLENELRAEREQRQSLQKALQREQDNSIELRTQLQQLQGLHTVSITHVRVGVTSFEMMKICSF